MSRIINSQGQLPEEGGVRRCGILQLERKRLGVKTEVSEKTTVLDKIKIKLLLFTKPCTVGSRGQYQS